MKKCTFLFGFIFFSIIGFCQYPEQFDLRDYNGNNYVTSVKSQQGGTCWTHGTVAAMEGNLLMTGNWAAAGESGEPALAEYHLDWWNGYNDYYNADLDPPLNNGQGLEVHQGGDYRVSTAYISRGDGHVREIDGQSYNTPPAFYESSYHLYYPMHVEWYTLGENFENMDLFKSKIMTEGVMATCMCYSSSYINGQYEHYQPASSNEEPNHSVSIIGWDNNREIAGAPGDGAWLVKNSWGASWGNDGYFWISYYDKHACQNPEMGAVSFLEVIPIPYDYVYYHDYHGWRDTLTTASEAFNKFIAEANGTITALSFFTAGENVDFEIRIYDDFDGSALSNLLSEESGSIEFSGLHTIPISVPVELTIGDDFYIYLNVSHGGICYDRTSDVPVLLGGGSKAIVTSTANSDESYYYSDTKGWLDFYDFDDPSGFQESGNFCIKALTQTVYAVDMGEIEVLDPTGNNNGQADPGETIEIVTSIINSGIYEITNVDGAYSSSDPNITINSAILEFDDLLPGEEGMATINLTVAINTPIGHNVEGLVSINCLSNGNSFSYDFDLSFKVGLIIEDFESGDFSAFDWEFNGDADWTITTSDVYEGAYCAKSGAIDDQEETELSLALDVVSDDEISFYRKVSTEAGYDYLFFFIDDVEMGQWAGEEAWEIENFPVTTGIHTFKWIFVKDNSVASGDDCAWLDYIVLPAMDQGMPAYFDLREYNGMNYVTSVKSQTSGTCWAHGTLAAMEGNLMMNGNWADTLDDVEPNLAEYHLDWWNGFNEYYNQDLNPPYNNNQGLEIHQGGDYRVSSAYMARGKGIVYSPEANDNTELDDNWFPSAPAHSDTNFSLYYSRDIEWFVLGENLENLNFIKQQIMQYGVMATCMCYTNGFINSDYEHYQPMSSTLDPNHSVAIVGWDDDREISGAPGNGAWMVKNSWGSNWGDNGYFWISYYDKHAVQHPEMGAVVFRNSQTYEFDNVYFHDYHGWRDTKEDITEALNAFELTHTETIEAVSFFTAIHDVDYTAIIYDDFDGDELSNELASVSGNIDFSGFHVIELEESFELNEGEDFYVYLSLSDGGHPYDRTSIVPVLLCGNNSKTLVPSTSNPEESYYHDGTAWVDFYYFDDPSGYQNSGNFCIKAITTGDFSTKIIENSLNLGYIENIYPNPFTEGTTFVYNLPENSDVQVTILNITGQEVYSSFKANQSVGKHENCWDGKGTNGNQIQSGIYLLKLTINGEVSITKRLLKVN